MAKRRSSDDVKDTRINCENCRYFTGLAYSLKWGCDKSHAQEKSYSFWRDTCPDYSAMTRDELFFRRFKLYAGYSGDAEIKKKRVTIRRTVTALHQAEAEFGKFMDSEQLEAIKHAANTLARVGDDLERAGRIAKQYHRDEEARRQKEVLDRRERTANEYFGITGEAKIVEIFEDLQAFASTDGKNWYRSRSRSEDAWIPIQGYDIRDALARFRDKRDEATLRALKLTAGDCIRELQQAGGAGTANLNDFEAFRKYRAEQREIARRAAIDQRIAPFPTRKT